MQRHGMFPRLKPDSKTMQALVDRALVVLALGLAVVLFCAIFFGEGGDAQGLEMVAIARSVADHGVFGNPFLSAATGPTAAEPPLYPLALALAFKILRTPTTVLLLATLGAVAANIGVAASLPALSREFFHTHIPGMIGGVLALLATAPIATWDTNWTQLGLVLFMIASAWLLRSPAGLFWRGAAAGAFAGLVSLLNPASALISLPCVAYLVIRNRVKPRGCFLFFAAFVLAALLINLPWLLRNYALWGQPAVRTNFGMTIYSSNNDCAVPRMDLMLKNGCYAATHPNQNAGEALYLQRIGEVAYDRQRTRDAVAWIQSHPARFAWLTRHRVVEFWLPLSAPGVYSLYTIWTVTVLSIPGLVWMLRRQQAALALFLSVFLIYPLPYYVVVSDSRYRVPILWMSCLAAGYFVWKLVEPRQRRS